MKRYVKPETQIIEITETESLMAASFTNGDSLGRVGLNYDADDAYGGNDINFGKGHGEGLWDFDDEE